MDNTFAYFIWTVIRGSELLASSSDYAKTYGQVLFRNKFLKSLLTQSVYFTVHYHYANDEMGSITHIVDDREILNQYEYDVLVNVVSQKETIKK